MSNATEITATFTLDTFAPDTHMYVGLALEMVDVDNALRNIRVDFFRTYNTDLSSVPADMLTDATKALKSEVYKSLEGNQKDYAMVLFSESESLRKALAAGNVIVTKWHNGEAKSPEHYNGKQKKAAAKDASVTFEYTYAEALKASRGKVASEGATEGTSEGTEGETEGTVSEITKLRERFADLVKFAEKHNLGDEFAKLIADASVAVATA
jgi:hypothetical protein